MICFINQFYIPMKFDVSWSLLKLLQYDQNMMEPQLISSCSLLELFFEEEEDLMGSEISRIYFPTRKRDRTTISHEIHCEIILKRDTGTADLVRIFIKGWGLRGRPNQSEFWKRACGDPWTAKPFRILKLGMGDPQTAGKPIRFFEIENQGSTNHQNGTYF